jgi:hypothetical protein
MGSHTMKTTIEIADDLFARVQAKARSERTTFRALTEQGLRHVLEDVPRQAKRLPPLVTVRGRGRAGEFQGAGWDRIRDEIYRARGV